MVSYKRTCSSKSLLNFRLSSTRLLIKWFLKKRTCSSKSFLNFRLPSTRLIITWFLIEKCVFCSPKVLIDHRMPFYIKGLTKIYFVERNPFLELQLTSFSTPRNHYYCHDYSFVLSMRMCSLNANPIPKEVIDCSSGVGISDLHPKTQCLVIFCIFMVKFL